MTGRRVLVVEDVSTTGSSPLTAVDAVREAGAEVVGGRRDRRPRGARDRGGGRAALPRRVHAGGPRAVVTGDPRPGCRRGSPSEALAGRPATRPGAARPTATGATWSTATGTGRLEAIVADLDTAPARRSHVAIENWQHDLNIGTVVRTANAFLAREVHHRRAAPVEPPGRDGHRPLPARPAPRRPSATLVRPRRGERLPLVGDRQPARRAAARDDRVAAAGACCCSARRAPGCATRPARRPPWSYSIAQYGSTRSINAGVAGRHRHAHLDPAARRAAPLTRALGRYGVVQSPLFPAARCPPGRPATVGGQNHHFSPRRVVRPGRPATVGGSMSRHFSPRRAVRRAV